jgi:hypothetical protein
MIKAKMISLNSVLKDVYLLMRESDINEDLVMEFAIRAMEHMVVYHTYEKAVCILRVDNCQAPYPRGTYGIEAVLYKQEVAQADIDIVTTATVNVEVDDFTNHLTSRSVDCKVANFRHVIMGAGSGGWQYLPLSNFTFDRGILCESIQSQPSNCTVEGTVLDTLSVKSGCSNYFIPDNANSRFITSFDSGWIMVAYYRFPQNNKGEFVVPDHPLYNEALESYILSKLYQRKWHMSEQGADSKYKHYLSKWQELSAAATGELMMLSLPDYVNLDKQNKFFKDDSPLKIFGGYGKEQLEMNNFRDSNMGFYKRPYL